MKIIPFNEKYVDEMVSLFKEAYSEPGYEWDDQTTKLYLERDYKYFPEYCFVAVNDDDKCLGAIFCSIDPYYKSKMLFVDSLQVKEEQREKGIGKALLKSAVEKAKIENFKGVHMLADGRAKFPKHWYQKLGFEETGWVEYEANLTDIVI